jgi:hypothetical protein
MRTNDVRVFALADTKLLSTAARESLSGSRQFRLTASSYVAGAAMMLGCYDYMAGGPNASSIRWRRVR